MYDEEELGQTMTDFDEFWACYPRKVAKGAARRAFAKALKIASMEEILEGVARYRQEIRQKSTEPQFICHPATWLNQERWADEYEIDLGPAPPKTEYREASEDEAREYYRQRGLMNVARSATLPEWAKKVPMEWKP